MFIHDLNPFICFLLLAVPFSRSLSRSCLSMMADPTFVYKLLIEQAVTIGASTAWEIKQRGER